jgi:hypothetical protein
MGFNQKSMALDEFGKRLLRDIRRYLLLIDNQKAVFKRRPFGWELYYVNQPK